MALSHCSFSEVSSLNLSIPYSLCLSRSNSSLFLCLCLSIFLYLPLSLLHSPSFCISLCLCLLCLFVSQYLSPCNIFERFPCNFFCLQSPLTNPLPFLLSFFLVFLSLSLSLFLLANSPFLSFPSLYILENNQVSASRQSWEEDAQLSDYHDLLQVSITKPKNKPY